MGVRSRLTRGGGVDEWPTTSAINGQVLHGAVRDGEGRAAAHARGWDRAACVVLLVLSACEPVLEEAVDSSVCSSGRRWVGETIGDAEMFPGEDCLDCHRRQDGPEFVVAGTVYGSDASGRERRENCFGVAGVRVQVTGADGHVFVATTNRAGNFFVEGSPSALETPFRAELTYTTVEGLVANPTMTHRPAYGGCARCHNPDAAETPELVPQSPAYVRPTEALFAL